ncbi:MAG TPA: tripartite tricarboxylate transporter substrate binding protein [Burkholderiales bacterium]|nr:tripartite tricarboxylate transporter substrate binding protein [Burkholderiales bacterium]
MVARPAALIALLLAGAVSAQDYPSRTIRMVVAFPPGGIADFAARSVSSGLTEALRVPVVVENRSGAGGSIGADFVAKAAPDGYTVLVTSISHTINPAFMKKLPFDTRRDFAPVMLIADAPNLLVVHPSVPARTLAELIGYARAHPGALAYASSGVGTSTHLCGELFKQMAKVDVVHVPYKGGGPAVADLLGGQVQMMFATLPTVLEHARSGRLRAIATTGAQRFAGAREFPTISESGLPGYDVSAWTGMFAPARTPRAAIDRLARETAKILRSSAIEERLLAQGAEAAVKMPDEFGAFVDAELDKWKKLVDSAHLHTE